MKDDPVFEIEQKHLTETYAKLQQMACDLVAKMDKASKDAAADKVQMSQELAPNLASDSDAMETYADFAAINRIIDAYNISQDLDAKKLADIQVLLKQPYFAKLVLEFDPEEKPKELYIGRAGMSDESYRRMIVDWRSPIAEVYYNQDEGRTSYVANDRRIEVDLKLRRQFDIEKNKLRGYFDTNVAIQDSLLVESLARSRSSYMRDITSTIQKEQNLVIRHEDVPALLVNGIAGSGKTSVLMQRIAYLFYQHRDTLDPSEVFLLTPNPVFRRYVDKVLPDLGEQNPECLTWFEFMDELLPPGRPRDFSSTKPLELFRQIDAACECVQFKERDFKDIVSGGERFFAAPQIRKIADKFKSNLAGPHIVALIREELLKRLESRFSQMANSEKVSNEIFALRPDEQVAILGETFDNQDEDQIKEVSRRYVAVRYASVQKAVENDEWLNVDRIGMEILGIESLSAVEWVYLKIALTGLGNPQAKYVMIDEVQDYTTAQLAVLARYFRRANFMLLGDSNQATNPEASSFTEIEALFRHMRGSFEECRLMTSYRSTSQITQLFAYLLDDTERMQISSIKRDETAPQVLEFESGEAYEKALREVVEKAASNESLTAVVVALKHQGKQIQKLFGENPPLLIEKDKSLPGNGVIIVPLKLAKGLEFDHVILADASEKIFPNDELSRRRLYTSISRATSGITILSKGPLTKLLKGYIPKV